MPPEGNTVSSDAPQQEQFPQYPIKTEVVERLDRDFTYHETKPGQLPRYRAIRSRARELAYMIAAYTPPSREQSLALTKIEEAVMWANAGIARNEP